MDDDKTIMSTDQILKLFSSGGNNNIIAYNVENIDIKELKKPHGKDNRHRLMNVNDYDLLSVIQQRLLLQNKCILDYITGGMHMCPFWGYDNIRHDIVEFAEKYVTETYRKRYPKDDDESEKMYNERLCHEVMKNRFPKQLQSFKCKHCLQHWLNSYEW